MLEVKKLGLAFLTSNLGKFSFTDGFFPDLDNIWNLDNFSNFLVNFLLLLLLLNLMILLLLFFISCFIILGDLVFYSIKIFGAAILLKSKINYKLKLAKSRKIWILQIDLSSS